MKPVNEVEKDFHEIGNKIEKVCDIEFFNYDIYFIEFKTKYDITKLDRKSYDKFLNFLNTYNKETDKYKIYFSYEISGFEYWYCMIGESNTIFITLYFNDIPVYNEDLNNIISDINEMLVTTNKEYNSYL